MLNAQYADLVAWFYPVGNTPAISLTRGQPPAGDAKTNILLLGCGDVRHILFTCNADGRPMDITCCDREKTIIARNIVLLSLLIDDNQGGKSTRHWKLYYHPYISESDLALLQSHARKLCGVSGSLEDWNQGPYGKIFRFADRRSLAQVREMWQQFALKRPPGSLRSFESHYHYRLQKSIGIRSQRRDATGSLRSLCPARIEHADDVKELKKEYWEDLPKRHKAYRQAGVDVRFNPMFSVPGSTSLLHVGTDPLDGYHVALAYIDTSGPVSLRNPKAHRALEMAKAEFCSWSFSFRKAVRNGLILRFFSGDALAFCQTLQHVRQHPDERTAHLYCDRHTFQPLTLDGDDWGPGGSAPLTFTVIDTSNLLDHLDGINLLPAVSPLLTCEPSACLYMELMSGRGQKPESLARSILHGDLPTIGLLAGLVPCDFCMNTSAVSAGHEFLVDYFKKVEGSSHGLVYITWKRALSHSSTHTPLLEPFHITVESLARILMGMIRDIYKREKSVPVLQKMSLAEIASEAGPTSMCHRGSIASFIKLIKPRVMTDFENVVKWLLFEMEHDEALALSLSGLYLEEFILHLHLQGVFTSEKLICSSPPQAMGFPPASFLFSWASLPPIVAVTLVIPRSSFSPFMQSDGQPNSSFGTPFLDCLVNIPRRKPHAFAAFQLGFGTLSTSGSRWNEDFQVQVSDDKSAWAGGSPLIVSFMAPKWILYQDPKNTEIALCIKSAPDTMHFVAQLGPELILFAAPLGDGEHVFISKNLPNQISPMGVGGFAACDVGTPRFADRIAEQSLEARTYSSTNHSVDIIGFNRRLHLKSPEIMSKLLAGEQMITTYISPWDLLITIGDCPPLMANFPVPVNRFAFRTRISRRADLIEIVDDLAIGPAWVTSGGSPYPIMRDNSQHTLWNLSYLQIDNLPEVLLTGERDLRWLQPHLSTTFSSTERRVGIEAERPGDHTDGCHPAQIARFRLKDSIYRICSQFGGMGEWRPKAFAIGVRTARDVQILIFPAKLRLDLSSRTVVLDAIVLQVTESFSKNHPNFLRLLMMTYGAAKPDLGEAELVLWKETLPAWVERCRTWTHKDECEYLREKRIPFSTEQLLCSCGNGQDLPQMPAPALPNWDEISKLCVRAAISPVFPCPLVDRVFGPEVLGDRPWYASTH